MWTAGSADSFRLQGSFEGCISGHDSNFSHRPYHKNCRCALHDKSRRLPGDLASPPVMCNAVSFSGRRRSPEERSRSLALVASRAGGKSRGSVLTEGFGSSAESLPLGDFGLWRNEVLPFTV